MRRLMFFVALASALLLSQRSFGQGYNLVVDYQKHEINEGDEISFKTSPSDGSTLILLKQNGNVELLSGGTITFEGSVESYFQQMLCNMTLQGWPENTANRTGIEFGYGSLMHMRDMMTADLMNQDDTYDYFRYYGRCLGEMQYASTMIVYPWVYFQSSVNKCNLLIQALEAVENPSDVQKYYLAVAYAFRAFFYLDMARMYEFLPNEAIRFVGPEGDYLTNLTVPIITEPLSRAEARNCTKPRATRKEMGEFILSDLEKAEKGIELQQRGTKRLPDLAVVNGLKARLFLWLENYELAQGYARRAINQGGYTPLSSEEILDVENGFNSLWAGAWMWGAQPTDTQAEWWWNNWPFLMSNEVGADGYNVFPSIPASLYKRIGSSDPRKKLFKPYPIATNLVRPEAKEDLTSAPQYSSLKFRAYGNYGDPFQNAKAAYPLMRVEEMYLIEAEAAAHVSPSYAKQLLENFVRTYRDPEFCLSASPSLQEITDAVFEQKRIELWGEGQIFFDYKRLDKPVDRTIAGDNWPEAYGRFKTKTRPAWMNIPFPFCGGYYADMPFIKTMNNPVIIGLYQDEEVYPRDICKADMELSESVENYECKMSAFSLMQDPEGEDMVRVDAYFGADVRQAFWALVDENLSDAEVISAWKTSGLEAAYKVNMTSPGKITYSYPHFPKAWATYRLVSFGEMADGTVKMLEIKLNSAEGRRFVHPDPEIDLGLLYVSNGILHVEYQSNDLPTTLQLCLIPDALSTGNVFDDLKQGVLYDLDKTKTEAEIAFSPEFLRYKSYIVARNGEGKVWSWKEGLTLDVTREYPEKITDIEYLDMSDGSTNLFPGVESALYYYSGQNLFSITNFMGSGVDLKFRVDTSHSGGYFDPNNLQTLKGDIIPVRNCEYDEEWGWYLYDDTNGKYPEWTIASTGESYYGLFFYQYSEEYSFSYSYIDFYDSSYHGGYCYFWGMQLFKDTDFNFDNYTNIMFYFK